MDQNLQDMEIGNTKEDVMTFDIDKQGYTQREWDRVVGIGKVPPEYQHPDEKEWSGQEDSNLRSPAPKAGALPG